jgi:hypothetical protein
VKVIRALLSPLNVRLKPDILKVTGTDTNGEQQVQIISYPQSSFITIKKGGEPTYPKPLSLRLPERQNGIGELETIAGNKQLNGVE